MSQQLSTIRQQIDSNNAAFMAAFRWGDSAGMTAAYTASAFCMVSWLDRFTRLLGLVPLFSQATGSV